MSDARQKLTRRQRYWLAHIQSCETSGKSIAEYAAEQGFTARAMYAGKKTLVKKGVLPRTRPGRFQRAKVFSPPVVGSDWRIQLPNGVLVVFSGTVDTGTLAAVLSTAADIG